MKDNRYDLAVIGGGPAGCAAAITAASCGLNTVLFEARRYPHDKLCGEFLSPECAGKLEGLGVGPQLQKEQPHPITHACLTAPDGFAWETGLPGPAWGLSRSSLDAMLAGRAEQAGAELMSGVTVDRIQGSLEDGFTLHAHEGQNRFSISAQTVIAAYGKRSGLDRALNRRFIYLKQPFVAFKTHFTGIHMPGRVELHAFPGGYCGFSMIESSGSSEPVTNVCFLARTEVVQRARQSGQKPLETFLAWMQRQNPHLESRLRQGQPLEGEWLSIAQVPFTPKLPVEGDLLMAGDSAGLIAPLAGDGISIALAGGKMAAELVFEHLNNRRSPAWLRQAYAHSWKQAFKRRLSLGRFLQGLLLNPTLASAGLRLVNAFPFLGGYFVSHTREMDQYHAR